MKNTSVIVLTLLLGVQHFAHGMAESPETHSHEFTIQHTKRSSSTTRSYLKKGAFVTVVATAVGLAGGCWWYGKSISDSIKHSRWNFVGPQAQKQGDAKLPESDTGSLSEEEDEESSDVKEKDTQKPEPQPQEQKEKIKAPEEIALKKEEIPQPQLESVPQETKTQPSTTPEVVKLEIEQRTSSPAPTEDMVDEKAEKELEQLPEQTPLLPAVQPRLLEAVMQDAVGYIQNIQNFLHSKGLVGTIGLISDEENLLVLYENNAMGEEQFEKECKEVLQEGIQALIPYPVKAIRFQHTSTTTVINRDYTFI